MSEVAINPDTGLPVLPEGMFWKVMPPVWNEYGTRESYTVGMYRRKLVEMVLPPYWFWQKARIVSSEEEDVSIKRAEIRAWDDRKFDEYDDAVLYAVTLDGEGWTVGNFGGWNSSEYWQAVNYRFDELNIQRVAIRIFKEWDEEQEEAARKARLVGTYPPKNLNVVNEEA